MISSVHELFKQIKGHETVLSHGFFVTVVKHLPRDSRKSWESLTTVATGATPKDDFGRMLLRIRNKIAFHYDPEEIFRGFKQQLLGANPPQDRAYISCGLSMAASRLYFADAAVGGYFQEIVGKDEVRQLSTKIHGVIELLNVALLRLVDQFIQRRGFAYGNT